jgi:acyl-CoA thioesterase I
MMRWLVIAVILLAGSGKVYAQTVGTPTPIPKSCEVKGSASASASAATSPLPRVASALKDRKQIKILTIGGASASQLGPAAGGYSGLIEKFLEQTFKGLDVVIVERGVSGELAADASERIKTEAALANADLVLWQVGTNDALAQVGSAEFKTVVADTVTWLKQRSVDVILVGTRFTPSVVKDVHYQALRNALKEVATEQDVLRISRYEAEETLARIRSEEGIIMSDIDVSDSAYVCMAEYLARAIVVNLYAKQPPPRAAPPRPQP